MTSSRLPHWVRVSAAAALVLVTLSSLALAATATHTAHEANDSLTTLRGVLASRCLQREPYLTASDDARRVQLRLYRTLAAQERHNRLLPAQLRRQRVIAYDQAAAQLHVVLTDSVPAQCTAYHR